MLGAKSSPSASLAVTSLEVGVELPLEAIEEMYLQLRTTGLVSLVVMVSQVEILSWRENKLKKDAFGQEIRMRRCLNTRVENVFKNVAIVVQISCDDVNKKKYLNVCVIFSEAKAILLNAAELWPRHVF